MTNTNLTLQPTKNIALFIGKLKFRGKLEETKAYVTPKVLKKEFTSISMMMNCFFEWLTNEMF